MKEKYLVINAGSSSLKFSLYDATSEEELINGLIEKIGLQDSSWTIKINGNKFVKSNPVMNHSEAVKVMLNELIEHKTINNIDEIKGIGHRVLHGGEKYSDSVIITDEVLQDINELTKLGPLHHPGELQGILAMQKLLPSIPQVAVFDTAFHYSIPKENYIYPVPMEWYKKYGVRKYGFHGTSHKYITQTMQEKLGKEDANLIICHIGSGASISCIKEGKCYDTTMGLTPLDGLMMGTRSGAIDPSILEYVCKETGKTISEVTNDLNKNSGLLGIAGKSDYRDVKALADEECEDAILAIKMLVNRISKYIVEYYLELEGKVDAIIFTAGMGENCMDVRKMIINKLSKVMPVSLNESINNNIYKNGEYQSGLISTSLIKVFVEPTNEEIMIERDTKRLIKNGKILCK